MCHYHHLTLVEREKNMFFHAQDNSVSAIAKKLGRNKATISRELRRNTKNGFYQPATAQRQYETRRKLCHPHKRLEDASLYA